MPTGERGSASGASLAYFRRVRTQGLALMLGLLLLVIGCAAERGTPAAADRSESQRVATRGQPNEGPRKAGSTEKNAQDKGPERAAPDPPDRGPHTIPGMNADAVASILLKPGLECFDPIDRSVLYACSSEDDHDLPLLYRGKITGLEADLVDRVEARVDRRGAKDFSLTAQPFFGLISTQLEYRGANKKRAYEFVSRNLNSTKANITIGAAEWTITSSQDRKTLTVAPDDHMRDGRSRSGCRRTR